MGLYIKLITKEVVATSRNWPKCNHFICDYMQLLVICDCLYPSLTIKRTTPKPLRTPRFENNVKNIDYQKEKNIRELH
jgi:hypothetical protein